MSPDQRFMDVWDRRDVLPGISHPLSVFFPGSELRSIEWGPQKVKDTVWLPSPQVNAAIEVSIVLVRPRVVLPNQWPGRGISPILEGRLLSGDTLWVLWHAFIMGQEKERQLHDDKEKALGLSRGALAGQDTRNLRMVLFGFNDRSRFFLDAAVSERVAT